MLRRTSHCTRRKLHQIAAGHTIFTQTQVDRTCDSILQESFMSGIVKGDKKILLTESDWVIPQANITISLPQNARSSPALSVYTFVFREFNVLTTPLSPLETKAVAYIDSEACKNFKSNEKIRW